MLVVCVQVGLGCQEPKRLLGVPENHPFLTRPNRDLFRGEKKPARGTCAGPWGGFCRGLDAAGRGPNPGSGRHLGAEIHERLPGFIANPD